MGEQTLHHGPQWAAIVAIAPELGCTRERLRRWVREAEETRPTPAEENCLNVMERESRKLRWAIDIFRKACAFCASSELDRPIR